MKENTKSFVNEIFFVVLVLTVIQVLIFVDDRFLTNVGAATPLICTSEIHSGQ